MPDKNRSRTWATSLLKAFFRDEPSCRGCGGKASQVSLKAVPLPRVKHRLHAVVTLCPNCESLIERLRQSKNVAAVFFYRREAVAKLYLMLS
jgi:uncharacterized protein with PIN domain